MGSDAILTEVVKAAPCPKVRAPVCVPPAVIRVGFFRSDAALVPVH